MFLIKLKSILTPPHSVILLGIKQDISLMHPDLGLFPAYYILEEDPKERHSIGGCVPAHVCVTLVAFWS